MRIYFAGSIRGGRQDAEIYFRMIEFLKNYGEVLTEHVGDYSLTEKGNDGPSDRLIHDRDLDWLMSADVIVAEVTAVSLGVGYEVGRAVSLGKKVLCLHREPAERKLSAMISGCPGVVVVYYTDFQDAMNAIAGFLSLLA